MTEFAVEEIRCYCRAAPLLAKFGIDERTKEPIVHIKSWKGERLYVDAIIVSGVVKLKCRACLRWYRVKIKQGAPQLHESKEVMT